MNFNYQFTAVEYLFIALFLLLYGVYIARVIWVARQLRVTARVIWIKFFFRTIYFALLIICLLGPFFGEPERDIIAEGKDIMVLVDVSKSMKSTDVQPSRFEKVKFELNRLVTSLPNNRFGMIVFSSSAFLQVPLTFDTEAFNLFIQALSLEQINSGGTNICAAIDMATQKLLYKRDSNNSKIILLFTDGENFGTCERKTLSLIRQFDIHFLAVGVGTLTGGRIKDQQDWVRNDEGEIVVTKLNANYLRNLTMATNGHYFEINNQANSIADIIKNINEVENKLIDSRKVKIVSNKYRYFLAVALLMMIVDALSVITTFKI